MNDYCRYPYAPNMSTYQCVCHFRLGNDFYFLPKDQCLFKDDPLSIPETEETLRYQQKQLIHGMRIAQMFPWGTWELPLPLRMERLQTRTGIFHYNPQKLSVLDINLAVARGKENQILNLGPYSKREVMSQLQPMETELCVVERVGGVEIRCAVTCAATRAEQMKYFIDTAEPGSNIGLETAVTVLALRTATPEASLEDNTSPPPAQSAHCPGRPEAPTPASAALSTSAEPRS